MTVLWVLLYYACMGKGEKLKDFIIAETRRFSWEVREQLRRWLHLKKQNQHRNKRLETLRLLDNSGFPLALLCAALQLPGSKVMVTKLT